INSASCNRTGARVAYSYARRRRDRLECDRLELDRHKCWSTTPSIVAEFCDGSERRVRRSERNRPWLPTVPRPASFTTDRLEGGGRGNRGIPCARRLR